jgi:hypothetical protein
MSSMPEKITKLLDKAAHEATPEDERESLIAKASELMTAYNIDAAMLAAKTQVFPSPSSKVFYIVPQFVVPKTSLLSAIAKSFSCVAIREKKASANNGVAEIRVFGFENEIIATETIYVSAVLIGMMKSDARRREGNTSRGFHSSYWLGFSIGVGEQLTAATKSATDEALSKNTGTAIVLADRSTLVDRMVKDTYPYITYTKRRYSNSSGFNAGKQDGVNANLRNSNSVGSNRRAIG